MPRMGLNAMPRVKRYDPWDMVLPSAVRKDTLHTVSYRGWYIQCHRESMNYRGKRLSREVVSVQNPETYASRRVKSIRAAKAFITRQENLNGS